MYAYPDVKTPGRRICIRDPRETQGWPKGGPREARGKPREAQSMPERLRKGPRRP